MIKKFVERWEEKKHLVEAEFREAHPRNYGEIVETIISSLFLEGEYDDPDPGRITEIDDGDYQGTLLYVIASNAYQPHVYWAVKVYYGSCSGCDTLEGIRGYRDGPPDENQVKDYMALALHIVQNLKEI